LALGAIFSCRYEPAERYWSFWLPTLSIHILANVKHQDSGHVEVTVEKSLSQPSQPSQTARLIGAG